MENKSEDRKTYDKMKEEGALLPGMEGEWEKDKYDFQRMKTLNNISISGKTPNIEDIYDNDFYYDEDEGWILDN